MANIVVSPISSTQATGQTLQNDFTGPSGEKLVSSTHGSWYNLAYRGGVFTFNRTAVTLPVVASNLVSVFSIHNPVASGKNMEIIRIDVGLVLATTVVNSLGLYYSTGALAAASTFTTAGTALSSIVGGNVQNSCIPYSALTHSGTPARHTILGFYGATTTTNANNWSYEPNGAILVPPGTVISLAMSTAAATTSSFDAGITWAEIPV